jgi:LuxR family transcriptional regulator, maltose regulon positive regulatory protein
MLSAILATKLYIPPPPPKVVFRPRLIERLNEGFLVGRTPGVTLISAPAGFGKTTLVSEWVAAPWHRPPGQVSDRQVAWLSLDEGDSDLTRFLTYLGAALRTVAPNIGEGVLGALQSPQPPPTEPILTALLNEIATLPDQYVLVLDDYHLIDAKPVDLALTFLLEHLPPQMHLVITSREDPQLPLARLRAQGQLTELRAADLRFTPTEAAEFFNQVMSLKLSAEDIAALEDRTEGWVAGLQLAALSTRGREDVHGFIGSFAGDNRYIVDYLVEEVLQRQPEPIRSFLLQTAILDRLNGPLCDAVTGQADSNGRLEALQGGNFFVVPLDDKRLWYRYHHLFAEVLCLHLMSEQPDQVATLHRRASVWFEQNGLAADAIHHALAGEDFERAADLVELAMPAMRRSRQETTMLGWLKALPDELLRCRPVLGVHYAGALLLGGQLEGVEARLRDAERWLDATADMGERPEAPSAETNPEKSRRMVVVDVEEFRRLPGSIAMYRAAIALTLGDVPATMKYARRTLDLVPDDAHLLRGAAAGLLGLAYWTSGNLEEAHRSYAECMARLQRARHISDAIGVAIALADIRIAQGRLHEAMSTYERGLQLSTEQGEPAPAVRGTADMYVGMSVLEREHNDLNAATQHLVRSQELGEHTGLPQNRYRWRVAMARIREAQGNLGGALDLLDEAERLYVSDFSPNVRPVAVSKIRVWVVQGRLGEALDWAQKQGLSVEDNLSYLREFEYITLARMLLARYMSNLADSSILEATGLLERLLKAAEEGGRMGSAIEILVLQALAHHVQGDLPAALMPLHRALTLAEPEGYVRMFVDEGPPMAQLLLEAAACEIMPDYTSKLLAAFKAAQQPDLVSRQASPGRSTGESPRPDASQPLIEPLSRRELEILRLFKTELSGPEIARELVIALSTVRTHTKSIFSKLNVNNRRAAVKRAAELGLI